MANEVIDIDFSTLDSCASRIAQEIEFIQNKITEINQCYSSLDSRVKTQLGGSFDTSELETVKTRLENTKTFLGEVKNVYSGADIDLSASLSVDYLEYLYPYFNTLSDERKAIVLSALRYLGLTASQMGYAQNFSSQYASSQFIGNATEHAWCAMFVGSIINYFYGDSSIIDPSYASVWKIIGNYQGQTGIAFETDDRIHYYVSQALVDKYKANGGFPSWENNLAKYNSEHGTNLQVSDWINDGYIPQPGDILTFKQGNRYYTSKKDAPLSDYNEAVERSRAAFFADNDSSDYPNDPQSYTHIGFVLGTREVDGVTYVDTVEGNVNDDVQVRSFRIDDPYLVGYGHIDYEKFASDKEAIQNMVATGVDTMASKATAATMSQHLLALNNGDIKGNYLVNLANNIDVVGTNLVVTDPQVTGQIQTISTSTGTQTENPTQQTTTTTTTATTTTTSSSSSHTTTTSHPTYTYTTSSSSQQTTTVQPVTTTTTTTTQQTTEQPTTTTTTEQPTTQTQAQETTTVTPTASPVEESVTVVVPQTTQTVVQTPVVEQVVPTTNAPIEETVSSTIVEPTVEDDLFDLNEDDFTYELDRNDDWTELDMEDTAIPDDDFSVISYDNSNNVTTESSSNKNGSKLGKLVLATLGAGAAAGGAAYIVHKSKKNNDTGEEEEEESEEEYNDEY